ncbi:cyclase [Microtetraspora sp. NBRC 13810]|uniref:cyclase family protein n=1 Tax=Microtetraspora sp. NBRC 13810 TaxID=3030990 RepID=UPI0024A24720|nr:cyclase family protein [Microtetraspora sp. NBRC 13810]GLW11230.1 cyclase [Microtetraspora sp. NBRC 13810]
MCSPETIMAALEGSPGAACGHPHGPPPPDTAAPGSLGGDGTAAAPGSPGGDGAGAGPGGRDREERGVGRRQALRAALAGVVGGGLGAAVAWLPARAAGDPAAAPPAAPPAAAARTGKVLDLTHPLGPDFPVFQLYVRRPVRRQVMFEDVAGFNTAEWTFNEHTGTHMDVPAHSREGLPTVDLIRAEDLVVPLCVVRIAGRAARDNITELTVKDLREWERKNGPIPERAFVASDSGWYRRVSDPAAYLQFDALAQVMRFPGISPEAADFLINQRSVVGFGTDTSSLDVGTRREPLVHRMLLTTGRYGIENLAALDTVPDRGATLVVGAAKLRGGYGAPVRALALL